MNNNHLHQFHFFSSHASPFSSLLFDQQLAPETKCINTYLSDHIIQIVVIMDTTLIVQFEHFISLVSIDHDYFKNSQIWINKKWGHLLCLFFHFNSFKILDMLKFQIVNFLRFYLNNFLSLSFKNDLVQSVTETIIWSAETLSSDNLKY